MLVSEGLGGLHGTAQLHLLQHRWWGVDLDHRDIGWFAVVRPFRYDLNKIPYNYAVEVTNRFKGLDLIDRVLEELWT